jgi:GNAT superfamily N-acetyltransferase
MRTENFFSNTKTQKFHVPISPIGVTPTGAGLAPVVLGRVTQEAQLPFAVTRETLRRLPNDVTIIKEITPETTSWKQESDGQFAQSLLLYAVKSGRFCGEVIAVKRMIHNANGEGSSENRSVFFRIKIHGENDPISTTEINEEPLPNMRSQGIGSALIEEMENEARAFGASRIEGLVFQADLNATLYLRDFYKRRGYLLIPNPDEEGEFSLIKLL